jgi:hypothetical protein
MVANETIGRQVEQRVARAAREGGEMTWTKTSGGWAVQTPSGGLYLVTETGCSCPDHTYRGSRTNTPCKHMIAAGIRKLERGEF